MKPSRDISRLIEILAALRDPQTGCPWDIQQTFSTIAPFTIEEAYEVLDAIQRDDMENLREELGDLLLQVVFHARMGEEAGHFDFGDVVEAITAKMIRRHPHVFADEEAREPDAVKVIWERVKAEEDQQRQERKKRSKETDEQSYLSDIPSALPALIHSLKLQKKASRVGFDWGATVPVLEKIEEEMAELRQAIDANDQEDVVEEFGDLLFAMVNLGRHLKLDPEAALQSANRKFRSRFRAVEKGLGAEGKTLESASLEEMEEFWQRAKGSKSKSG